MRYIVLSVVSLLGILSVIGLVNVLFGGIAKIQVRPEFDYYVTAYSLSAILLSVTTFLYWKRRKSAAAVFGSWLVTTIVLSLWSGLNLTGILLLVTISILVLILMVLDLRRSEH